MKIFQFVIFVVLSVAAMYLTKDIENYIMQITATGALTWLVLVLIFGKSRARDGFMVIFKVVGVLCLAYILGIIKK